MLSLILPTFNEAENLPVLLPKIAAVLEGIEHEVIIVDDDSPDETWKIALDLAHDQDGVHVIRRIGRRGLSSAVVEGFLAAKGNVFAVMDADGQHDLHLLPHLYEAVAGGSGIALGSRYAEGGSVGQWDERRYCMSRFATWLAVRLCRVKVRDPMSGFFAIDRLLFESVVDRLNPKGFKILLDLLVHVPKNTQVTELPFTFAERLHGQSKLNMRVQIEFLEYLYDVTAGSVIPLTFVKYCIVGGMGVFVHMGTFLLVSRMLMGGGALTFMGFSAAVVVAIEVAIVFNFLLNNLWTFASHRLHGAAAFVGFAKYNLACAFGAVMNYAVSSYLFVHGWGAFTSAFIGVFASVIWNYTMSRVFTWKG